MGISLVPREDKFFELFEESAKNLVQIALALKNMLDEFTDIENKMNIITGMEHKGDSVTHEIMALLHRSFVTPFDREDIALLAHTMDDIADLIHASADAMCIYHITAPLRFSGDGRYSDTDHPGN